VSGREKREERREMCVYTYTHTHIPRRIQFYLPDNKKHILREAKEIFKREGTSLSRFLVDKLEEYVELHAPGNPQQRIDTIIQIGKAYHAPLVCAIKNCLRNAKFQGIYKVNGKTYPLCEIHAKEMNEYTNWQIKKPRNRRG